MKAYDDQAADTYSRVVTHYSMAAACGRCA